MKSTKVLLVVLATGCLMLLGSCTDSSQEDAKLYENNEAVDYTNVKRPK